MQKIFPCFTDKMDYLFKDIVTSLGQLPFDLRSFLFGGEDDIDMECVLGMARYITMEYIKYAFDSYFSSSLPMYKILSYLFS